MNKEVFRSRRVLILGVAAGGLLAMAGVAVAFTRSGGATPAPRAATATATPGARAAQPAREELKRQVEAGKLDQAVFDEITARGEAEALVVLDDERAEASLKQLAAARGLRLDDEKITELRPVIYAEIKRQVAAAAPEHARTVEDFESFGVARVRFTSEQALLETLQRPEIAGVREIQQYTRPS